MAEQIWDIIHLRFTGALHLSRGRDNSYDKSESSLHSDKLKSALFATLNSFLGNKAAKMLLDDLLISSAFPFSVNDGTSIYFLPNPLLPLRNVKIIGLEENRRNKKLKKIEYLSIEAFQKIYQPQTSEEVTLDLKCISKDGRFLHIDSLEDVPFSETSVSQHVYVNPHFGGDNVPFYIDRMCFSKGSGLFFLAKNKNTAVRKDLITALGLLADAGIGTDRNSGYGHFDFKPERDITNLSFKIQDEGDYEMCLSLYCPHSDDLQELNKSSYKLLKRGGFIASPENPEHLRLRKKSVFMFQEGSVFPKRAGRLGVIKKLKPDSERLKQNKVKVSVDHEIWRDGRAIFIPITTKV